MNTLKTTTSALAFMAAAVIYPVSALAQTPPTPQDHQEATDVGEVVVTGSRLRNSGFSAPTPVTVVGQQLIEERAPAAIAEVLLELPAFRNGNSQTGNQFTINTAGQNILELRGLGPVRTLVLLDGRRFVATSTTTVFDTNLIPTSLIQQTEVVTGGASAQYGSDAVAGVVNFILKEDLEGLHIVAQAGQTAHDDNKEAYTSIGWGSSFGGGRGHVILGGEYSDSQGVGLGVGQYARDWGAREFGVVTLPANRAAGLPAQIISDNVQSAVNSFGGLVTGSTTNAGAASTILRGTNFGPNGTILPFQFGTLLGTTAMSGTNSNFGTTPTAPQVLKVPNERFSTLARVTYDLSDDLTVFAEASHGQQEANTNTSYNNFPGLIIGVANPFLPTSIRDTMAANNLRSITLGRTERDQRPVSAINTNETTRGVIGARGNLAYDFTWDAYYTQGRNLYANNVLNAPLTANYRAAINAVRDPLTNQIVCGPVATNPNLSPAQRLVVQPGCVPYNVIGQGSPSAAAIDYVTDLQYNHIESKQTAAGFNINGSPFDMPAGPVSLAFGGEYRKDQSEGNTLLASQQNLFLFGNYKPISGEISVREGYVEVGVPILADAALAKSFDVNAAYRTTDYSTSGVVSTWKVGATWEPNDDLRLRLTRSRDIRAPNINELFTQGGGGLNQIRNPANGITAQVQTINAGNPDLTPEIANTWTAGVVLQPTWDWASGFRASVDVYQIEIEDAIAVVAPQDVINRCAAGQTVFCPAINFDPSATNGIASVVGRPFNANSLETRGVDFEVSYLTDLDRFVSSVPGTLNIRALATYLDTLETFDPTGASLGQQAGATLSQWRGNVSVNYTLNRFSATLSTRLFTSVKYSVTLLGPEDEGYSPTLSNSVSKNRFPGMGYANFTASYNLIDEGSRRLQIFGVVDNIMDKDPPYGSVLIGSGSPYDYTGRSFKIGLRADF